MNWLRDFSYRFTPTIAARLAREPLSNIPSTIDVLEDDIVKQLHAVFSGLSAAFSSPQKSWSPEERKKAKELIERTVGFSLNRRDSQVSGQGIFVNQGKIRCGQMASLYPGTVYLPGEPMLIQSINNHYVLRCQDGLIVDGNANGISARIHRSCALRDVSPMVPDLTWLDRNEEPINYLNMGQRYPKLLTQLHELQNTATGRFLVASMEVSVKRRAYIEILVFSMEKRIQRFCEVDPNDFFERPPKDFPPSLPALAMEVFPPLAEFIEFGGASKHVLTNTGVQRLVFKVKCSNNALFKVSPVYAFIDPGASMDLQILRQEGPTRNDKLILMFKEAKKGEKDPRKGFESEGATGKKVLPLITRDVLET